MKFGVVTADIAAAKDLYKKIAKFLEEKGHEVVSDRLNSAEVVLTLGGDGTLIHAACEHADLGVPFLGINAGTVGFLTAVEADEWKEAVERIIKGDYVVSERMILEASIGQNVHLRGAKAHLGGERGGDFRAVNEIVVKGMYRVVDLEILVNGQKFLDISGDGVIVATPTGSTAYSLSAGGPIVDPEIDCLLVTPINAVGLPIPSVALSSDDDVEINIEKGDDVSLVIDGQEHVKVSTNQRIKVSKGKYRVKFGYFDKHHFLKALNGKFGLASRIVGK